ncbi:MAG: recombinase family protein [Anaeromicrobium sp.]|jgi:DNA invertase Pin-like site-specific DNA recombinase|uniref:recombinase family protein n=1 Tax=Anaeromicrobium sp. TaxID=1929132 RepID=UPI0025CC17D3|nr:recombinase family protein [Anaeromicrobium sp.]MCT4593753.1 recombinase family protein [Anaeromicrobium sp.]
MNCAVYVRVSTEKEIQDSSMAHQEEFFKKYVKEKGFTIYKIYKDRESACSLKNRMGLKKLIKDSEEKKFNIVLTKSISRFARNTLEGLTIIRKFKEENIRFITIEDSFDSNEYDEFTFTILLSLAQKESQKISERISFGKLCRAREGYFNGSVVPYGYMKLDKNTILPKEDMSTLVVKKIFNMYARGEGLASIVRYLNHNRYPTPSQSRGMAQKNRWYESTIRNILSNEFYIGNLIQNKSKTKNLLTKKRYKKEKGEFICRVKTHQPIIDEDLFYEVQEKLRSNKYMKYPKTSLFSNILYCQKCGHKMYYRKNTKNYLCSTYIKRGKVICPGVSMKEHILKEKIINEMKGEFFKKISCYDKFEIEKTIKNINKNIEIIKNKENRLLDNLLENVIDRDTYRGKKSILENEMKLYEKEKEEISKRVNSTDKIYPINRKFISEHIKKVIVAEENIEIQYRM